MSDSVPHDRRTTPDMTNLFRYSETSEELKPAGDRYLGVLCRENPA